MITKKLMILGDDDGELSYVIDRNFGPEYAIIGDGGIIFGTNDKVQFLNYWKTHHMSWVVDTSFKIGNNTYCGYLTVDQLEKIIK